MNPVQNGKPNFWLSCMLINKDALADTARSGRKAVYSEEKGKSSPSEILEALAAFHAEGRPVWKPMHMQPIYASNGFVTKSGDGRGGSDVYGRNDGDGAVSTDLFERGLCLPSDNKLEQGQQDLVIEVVQRCFQ